MALASGSYLPDWPTTFNPGLDLNTVTGRFRLAQAQALRVWCQAKARDWTQHADAIRTSVEQWAEHVQPEVRHAQLQDLLARALHEEGGAAALPVLQGLGASLLEPHPSFDPRHHPMHVALQPSPRNAKVLGAVMACLPNAPFANGADPFPGWPRDHALQTLFQHQFGQKAWERANALGLTPSPLEQGHIMSVWLRNRNRKRCTIALQDWGWEPEPSADLMNGWWSAHAWDEQQPDRLHGFDRQWVERFSDRLGFCPAIRTMQEIPPLNNGSTTMAYHLLKSLDTIVQTYQRTIQWLNLVPLREDEQTLALQTFDAMSARVNAWQAGWTKPNGVADQQQLEAKVLRLEMDQQACRAMLTGVSMAPDLRQRARL